MEQVGQDRRMDATAGAGGDRARWAGLAAQDPACLAELFDAHSRAVYNFAFRRTASWSSAEDVTQATFITLWRRAVADTLPVLEHDSALPWLFAVADQESRNTVRGRGRRERLRTRLTLLEPTRDVGADHADHADQVAQRLDDERRMSDLRKAVDKLPPHERMTIELVSWSGLSLAEAATTLGVAEGTVKSRLWRARSRLAALLSPVDDGETR